MKSRFSVLIVISACIISIGTVFIGCENDVNAVVKYVGKVVYSGTTKPFANLEIKVTNGPESVSFSLSVAIAAPRTSFPF